MQIYLLADTTYNSLGVDEIAAAHVDAEAVVSSQDACSKACQVGKALDKSLCIFCRFTSGEPLSAPFPGYQHTLFLAMRLWTLIDARNRLCSMPLLPSIPKA